MSWNQNENRTRWIRSLLECMKASYPRYRYANVSISFQCARYRIVECVVSFEQQGLDVDLTKEKLEETIMTGPLRLEINGGRLAQLQETVVYNAYFGVDASLTGETGKEVLELVPKEGRPFFLGFTKGVHPRSHPPNSKKRIIYESLELDFSLTPGRLAYKKIDSQVLNGDPNQRRERVIYIECKLSTPTTQTISWFDISFGDGIPNSPLDDRKKKKKKSVEKKRAARKNK